MKNLILGIDCSGAMTSVGLASGEEELGESNLLLGRRQSRELPRMVSEMLRLGEGELNDLSALAVTRGPGFFSGIRVGISYGLSLAFSLNIPVIPLSSLEVLAFGAALEEIPVISLIPAKRGAFFCGAYILHHGEFSPPPRRELSLPFPGGGAGGEAGGRVSPGVLCSGHLLCGDSRLWGNADNSGENPYTGAQASGAGPGERVPEPGNPKGFLSANHLVEENPPFSRGIFLSPLLCKRIQTPGIPSGNDVKIYHFSFPCNFFELVIYMIPYFVFSTHILRDFMEF